MAWAIFTREANWARPKSRFSFNAKPSDVPQERPKDFVDYCVSRGWAKRVRSPDRETAKTLKQR